MLLSCEPCRHVQIIDTDETIRTLPPGRRILAVHHHGRSNGPRHLVRGRQQVPLTGSSETSRQSRPLDAFAVVRHANTPSFAQWAQTVELILAIEPDPTVAMAWFVGEDIAELDGLTGYELVQAAKKSLLDDFLRAILEGHRD